MFRSLPEDECSNYDKATQSLKKWFRTGDIEELRCLEFHHMTQGNETVEQLGIDLQRLRHFPPPKESSLTVCSKADSFRPSMSNGSINWAPQNRRRLRELYNRARTSMRSSMRHPLPLRVTHTGPVRRMSKQVHRPETPLVRVLTVRSPQTTLYFPD